MTTETGVAELLGDQVVDLNNCDREPIHRIGAIQSVGLLIGHDGQRISHLADADGLTGLTVGDPVGAIPEPVRSIGLDVRVDAFGSSWFGASHQVARTTVIELEPVIDFEQLDTLPALVSSMSQRIEAASDLNAARHLAADLVRSLTGFDRVMVYEFHPDDHGEVVAEAKVDELEPLLGLHYPATDIPRQARALLVLNPIRQFVDVGAAPAPIQRAEDAPELDLSSSLLRAHSPIHTQYLVNMGVGATLTVSITAGKKLLGMIACHHRAPRHIPLPVRRTAELLARLLSEQFARRAAAEREQIEQVRLATQFLFLRELIANPDHHVARTRLLDSMPGLVSCEGFLARHGDELELAGTVANSGAVDREILRLLAANPDLDLCATDRLDGGHGGAIVARDTDGYVAWFRPPAAREVRWAGASDSTVAGHKDLTPRASFTTFVERLADRSQPWSEQDLIIAGLAQRALAASANDAVTHSSFEELVLALAAHAQNLELANLELGRASRDMEEFAYVVAHDLRAPLRSVRSFLQLFREDAAEQLSAAPPLAIESLDLATEATSSMQDLLEGMLEYAQVGRNRTARELIHLSDIVDTAALTLVAHHPDLTIDVGDLPQIEADPPMLTTLVTNLLDNAAKYRADDRDPVVRVSALERAGTVELRFEDNGMGVDPALADHVFEMFRRGTSRGDGVGAGLAIVKRIVDSHGGELRLESEPGVGSAFVVELPVKARPQLQSGG